MTTPPTVLAEDAQLIEKLYKYANELIINRCLDSASLIASASERIRTLSARSLDGGEWIALSERKPTKGDASPFETVLVLWNDGDVRTSSFYHVRNDTNSSPQITHWRRLPAPPQPTPTPEEVQASDDAAAYKKACETWADLKGTNIYAANLWCEALAYARTSQRTGGSNK